MVNIVDLPEDILLDVLTWVPAKDLVLSCRLVCSHWRDLVDLPTPWKRKCQKEGFYSLQLDRSVQDWRAAYFLFSLRRNLIKNPSAEEGFNFWEIQSNGGHEWKVETIPGDHGTDFPDPHVRKYFVTSFEACTKQQLISLKEEGYWDQLMDEAKPAIVVHDWYAARRDCGCSYQLSVKLLSSDYIVLEEFSPEDVVIEQWSDAEWHKVSHTFRDYPSGVRYLLFWHGGQDTQYWAGWYGVRVTNSSVTITPDVVG
ncbi:F-box only protein 6-like isoform X2 [Hemicordylus capensis]|nr:F-box only protein 6-like isoform X2 [Hemicordylus capensis]